MKRKKINGFYMHAQQAVLVRECVSSISRQNKHTANARTFKHMLYDYVHACTDMTSSMATHAWYTNLQDIHNTQHVHAYNSVC